MMRHFVAGQVCLVAVVRFFEKVCRVDRDTAHVATAMIAENGEWIGRVGVKTTISGPWSPAPGAKPP